MHAARGAAFLVVGMTKGFSARSICPAYFICAEGALVADKEDRRDIVQRIRPRRHRVHTKPAMGKNASHPTDAGSPRRASASATTASMTLRIDGTHPKSEPAVRSQPGCPSGVGDPYYPRAPTSAYPSPPKGYADGLHWPRMT
jgi:hypothetical protein